MPTIFSHAIFSASLGAAYATEPMPARFWMWAGLCSVLPDLDVIAFAFGIPYSSVWGHRGVTHSLLFALLAGWAIARWAISEEDLNLMNRSRASLAVFFSLATASHLALDALTNGGLGVAVFAPFDDTRYFAPWRPIRVSPIGPDFFSARGLRVLASELFWVWLPAIIIVLLGRLYHRINRHDKTT
ncbi:MAG TPA: metal-dependent hydrolase [Blastocatellia bacterium]|nr:metal-dependent hydrolase [Blastocatellia bacterium]HMV82098.1 metal-dependent hydrolase [Blastocatellia bacterium]HMX24426.1 metal-dependent hydrolase [Blastocatellia bacterium]HMY74979.1 metal-dependent hydrolase [Blastocatellia bacterium]HMZ21988.1 metal-dependent hydrolase [Blastocatellia bacterium]